MGGGLYAGRSSHDPFDGDVPAAKAAVVIMLSGGRDMKLQVIRNPAVAAGCPRCGDKETVIVMVGSVPVLHIFLRLPCRNDRYVPVPHRRLRLRKAYYCREKSGVDYSLR